jgi:hypothetical protein
MMNDVKDSGERRTFETGAQRDRAFGKGLPTLISPIFVRDLIAKTNPGPLEGDLLALDIAYEILETGDWTKALDIFDALTSDYPSGLRLLSYQLEKGAAKYSARNWEKGMPLEEYLNSLIRHILAVIEGKNDEPHLDAALFNAMALYHTGKMIQRCLLPSTLDNLPKPINYVREII